MDQPQCKRCGAQFEEKDIHEDLAVARCPHCRGITDLADRFGEAHPEVAARRAVPLPEKFEVSEQGSHLEIRWRWRSLRHFFMIPFCVFWDGFLVLWYGLAMNISGPATPEVGPEASGVNVVRWIFLLFPLGHVAVGVGITYATLAGLFNRTTLRAHREGLSIEHGPLPWRGNREVTRRELEQLFVEEHVARHKNGRSYSYRLLAILRHEHRRVPLLKNLESANQALYLEQKLEKHLRIEDAPVEGELAQRQGA